MATAAMAKTAAIAASGPPRRAMWAVMGLTFRSARPGPALGRDRWPGCDVRWLRLDVAVAIAGAAVVVGVLVAAVALRNGVGRLRRSRGGRRGRGVVHRAGMAVMMRHRRRRRGGMRR